LRNDPVAHLNAEYQTELARVSSQDVGAPLTRVSATFSASTREVSQNGNRIRVMSNMESFQRSPRSMPTDGLTIASASRGVQSAKRCRYCGRDTASLQDSAPLARLAIWRSFRSGVVEDKITLRLRPSKPITAARCPPGNSLKLQDAPTLRASPATPQWFPFGPS
jgi:hypothetical protein